MTILMRNMWWLLLLLLPTAFAATVEINGVAVVYDEDRVSVSSVIVEGNKMTVTFSAMLPNPCYTTNVQTVVEEFHKIKVYLIPPPPGTVCAQVVSEKTLSVEMPFTTDVDIDVELAKAAEREEIAEQQMEEGMKEEIEKEKRIRESMPEIVVGRERERPKEVEKIRKIVEEGTIRRPPRAPAIIGPPAEVCDKLLATLKESTAGERAIYVVQKICSEEKPGEVLKKVCEEGILPLRAQRIFCKGVTEAIVVKDKTVEELKKEIERLRKELAKAREEIRRLRIKVEELKKKLIITAKGIVDPETGEEISIPEAEIDVTLQNKVVKVVKERNTVKIKAGEAEVEVSAPVAVAKGTLEVNNKPVRVTPDEVLERVRKKVEALEKVQLEVKDDKPVYKVKAKKKGRLLFILPVEVPIEVEIDAEEGKELREVRPWWAFLVFP